MSTSFGKIFVSLLVTTKMLLETHRQCTSLTEKTEFPFFLFLKYLTFVRYWIV